MAEDSILGQEARRQKRKMPVPLRLAVMAVLAGILIDHVYPWEVLLKLGPGYGGRKPVQPDYVTPTQVVPLEIPLPPWGRTPDGKVATNDTRYLKWVDTQSEHDENGAAAMRAAGAIAAQALDLARTLVAPGVTTDDIDAAVHKFIVGKGAYPTPLHFMEFPKSVCTSVNEIQVHGIPDLRPLEEGDIVNVDVTAYFGGVHADTSATFAVGTTTSRKVLDLLSATREALDAAVAACGPGKQYRVIGQAIQEVADRHGMRTVRAFVGHGIGTAFHQAPRVHHFAPQGWWDVSGWMQVLFSTHYWTTMRPGVTFTIEPILIEPGGTARFTVWDDKWTAASMDGSLSAQFEYTVLVQEPGREEGQGGCEIITPFWWERPQEAPPASAAASE